MVTTRLRDIGDADLCSSDGMALACRVAVSIDAEDEGAWSGQVWPYRPLALTPGPYTVRIRGEDVGAVRVAGSTMHGDREVASFVGFGRPGADLRALTTHGGVASSPKRRAPFPRVSGEVQPTMLAVIVGALVGMARGLLTPARRGGARRGWGSETLHRLRR